MAVGIRIYATKTKTTIRKQKITINVEKYGILSMISLSDYFIRWLNWNVPKRLLYAFLSSWRFSCIYTTSTTKAPVLMRETRNSHYISFCGCIFFRVLKTHVFPPFQEYTHTHTYYNYGIRYCEWCVEIYWLISVSQKCFFFFLYKWGLYHVYMYEIYYTISWPW